MLGDCIKLMANVPSHSVDMILCDLPYGTTQNKWDSVISLPAPWEQYVRITKPNAAIVLTAQPPFDKVLACSNMRMFRYEWIWHKTMATGQLNANKMPLKAHENVLVFYQRLPVYNPQKTQGHPRKVSTTSHGRNSKKTTNYGEYGKLDYDSTERYPRDVLTFASDKQRSALHPTQKPLALFEYMVKTYTNGGGSSWTIAADLVLLQLLAYGPDGNLYAWRWIRRALRFREKEYKVKDSRGKTRLKAVEGQKTPLFGREAGSFFS